jgi:hypothetical protein
MTEHAMTEHGNVLLRLDPAVRDTLAVVEATASSPGSSLVTRQVPAAGRSRS